MTPKEKAKELYDKFYEWYPKQDAEFIAEQYYSETYKAQAHDKQQS